MRSARAQAHEIVGATILSTVGFIAHLRSSSEELAIGVPEAEAISLGLDLPHVPQGRLCSPSATVASRDGVGQAQGGLALQILRKGCQGFATLSSPRRFEPAVSSDSPPPSANGAVFGIFLASEARRLVMTLLVRAFRSKRGCEQRMIGALQDLATRTIRDRQAEAVLICQQRGALDGVLWIENCAREPGHRAPISEECPGGFFEQVSADCRLQFLDGFYRFPLPPCQVWWLRFDQQPNHDPERVRGLLDLARRAAADIHVVGVSLYRAIDEPIAIIGFLALTPGITPQNTSRRNPRSRPTRILSTVPLPGVPCPSSGQSDGFRRVPVLPCLRIATRVRRSGRAPLLGSRRPSLGRRWMKPAQDERQRDDPIDSDLHRHVRTMRSDVATNQREPRSTARVRLLRRPGPAPSGSSAFRSAWQ